MNRICWKLVDIVSRALEPGERDIVRGDFAESQQTGPQALRDVLGLVARRQMAPWHNWRPWLILAGLVVPLGLLLSLLSNHVASMNSVYSWMYFNNWDWSLLQHRAFWIVLAQTIVLVFPDILALICLSWAIGFTLGDLSRRTIPVNGVLFCLVLLFGALVAAPQYMRLQVHFMTLGFHPRNTGPDPVSSLTLYRVLFPVLVQIILVLLPSLLGMYKGARSHRLSLPLRMILWVLALGSMAVLAAMQGIWWVALVTQSRPWFHPIWQKPPWLLAIAGPVMYWLATAARKRHSGAGNPACSRL
ncbi:MAG: hypothetical protein LAP38_02655 [Acidobacteriia bacterium]|nr:hypothetical protein [Terriglobia bacterium]